MTAWRLLAYSALSSGASSIYIISARSKHAMPSLRAVAPQAPFFAILSLRHAPPSTRPSHYDIYRVGGTWWKEAAEKRKKAWAAEDRAVIRVDNVLRTSTACLRLPAKTSCLLSLRASTS